MAEDELTMVYESLDDELHELVKLQVTSPINQLIDVITKKLTSWALESLHLINNNITTVNVNRAVLAKIMRDPRRFAEQLVSTEMKKRILKHDEPIAESYKRKSKNEGA